MITAVITAYYRAYPYATSVYRMHTRWCVPLGPPAGACNVRPGYNWGIVALWHWGIVGSEFYTGNAASNDACCSLCSSTPPCTGWSRRQVSVCVGLKLAYESDCLCLCVNCSLTVLLLALPTRPISPHMQDNGECYLKVAQNAGPGDGF